MLIALPQEISDARLDTVLLVFDQVGSQKEVVLDFSRVGTVSPAGHAILMNLVDKVIESQCQVQCLSIHSQLKSYRGIQLLEKVSTLKKMPDSKDGKIYQKNLLVQVVENSICPGFLDDMDELFQDQINEEKRWFVRLILNELMQNAHDHSTSERYCMYVGIVDDEVHFGICDLGVTIPAKLEQKYNCENDVEYLLKSLEFGVGTRRTKVGGLGLNHMFEILKKQDGRLVIVSRNAQIRKYFHQRKTEKNFLKHTLRGTWCFARMPLEAHV